MSSTPVPLRPGLLVTIATRVDGGCQYQRVDLDHQLVDTTDIARWETQRTIADKAEFDEATQVRSTARSRIASACVSTPFGFLICPTDQEELLNARVAEAQQLVADFNAKAKHSRIRVITVRGLIAPNDTEALTAVRHDLAQLLATLEGAIAARDVDAIRAAANDATRVGKLLDQQSAAKVALDDAISTARKAARAIAKNVEGAAQQLSTVLQRIETSPIARARFLFDPTPDAGAAATESSEALPSISFARLDALEVEPPEVESAPDDVVGYRQEAA